MPNLAGAVYNFVVGSRDKHDMCHLIGAGITPSLAARRGGRLSGRSTRFSGPRVHTTLWTESKCTRMESEGVMVFRG